MVISPLLFLLFINDTPKASALALQYAYLQTIALYTGESNDWKTRYYCKKTDYTGELEYHMGNVIQPIEIQHFENLARFENIAAVLHLALLDPKRGWYSPSKHEVLAKCWADVGPSSTTLAQHQSNIWPTPRVCWGLSSDLSWSPHVDNTAHKANQKLGFIRRYMRGSPTSYKCLVYFIGLQCHWKCCIHMGSSLQRWHS